MKKLISIAITTALLLAGSTCIGATESITIQVSPQTILVGADQADMVTVHAEIPYSLVNETAPLTLTLNGVAVQFTFADNRGDLVAKFLASDIKKLLGVVPPHVTLILSGVTEDGIPFSGSDEVRVTVWKVR